MNQTVDPIVTTMAFGVGTFNSHFVTVSKGTNETVGEMFEI